ncbi:MAG: hypothetical protein LBD43_01385 [Holosporales bacterium]|nr:hypothetical protein [Holosporales bacterium]
MLFLKIDEFVHRSQIVLLRYCDTLYRLVECFLRRTKDERVVSEDRISCLVSTVTVERPARDSKITVPPPGNVTKTTPLVTPVILHSRKGVAVHRVGFAKRTKHHDKPTERKRRINRPAVLPQLPLELPEDRAGGGVQPGG